MWRSGRSRVRDGETGSPMTRDGRQRCKWGRDVFQAVARGRQSERSRTRAPCDTLGQSPALVAAPAGSRPSGKRARSAAAIPGCDMKSLGTKLSFR